MKIQQKLFLVQCSFSLALVATLTLLMQWSIANGMVEYVNTKEIETLAPVISVLAAEYEKKNNWSSMHNYDKKFNDLILKQLSNSDFMPYPPEQDENFYPPHPPKHMPPPRHFGENSKPPQNGRPPKRKPPAPKTHHVLLDSKGNHVVGNYAKELEYRNTPIHVNGDIVGYLSVSKRNKLTQGYELDFIEKQQNYLWFIGVIVMLFVILITLPLARHLVEPIKLITKGMHKLTQGDYKQQINLQRKDELGELSRDYNELAFTLSANEDARKRWLANISHELRTPVAILSLELEAMLDGIRPLNKENIISANDELKHLAKLIDDLHQLTLTDIGGMQYNKSNENLTELLQTEKNKYKGYLAEKGITLTLNLTNAPIIIYVDKTRLLQLFDNIINNTIKYADASQMSISSHIVNAHINTEEAIPHTKHVILTFEDNGIGVESKHLPYLFEYLYRTDHSRNRTIGGAGLGLSICRHIVNAHQGDISAQQSRLGGLSIQIKFPLA